MAAVFHVIALGQRRDHGGSTFDLADTAQDDFGTAIIDLEGSADFDGSSREAADITDIFQIVGEDYDGEGASHLVFTEVEEVNSLRADFDPDDLSTDTFDLADVLAGLVDREAVRGAGGCGA